MPCPAHNPHSPAPACTRPPTHPERRPRNPRSSERECNDYGPRRQPPVWVWHKPAFRFATQRLTPTRLPRGTHSPTRCAPTRTPTPALRTRKPCGDLPSPPPQPRAPPPTHSLSASSQPHLLLGHRRPRPHQILHRLHLLQQHVRQLVNVLRRLLEPFVRLRQQRHILPAVGELLLQPHRPGCATAVLVGDHPRVLLTERVGGGQLLADLRQQAVGHVGRLPWPVRHGDSTLADVPVEEPDPQDNISQLDQLRRLVVPREASEGLESDARKDRLERGRDLALRGAV
eukprot:scaffold6432_cov107-Isochrysis_galbana.AAC.3